MAERCGGTGKIGTPAWWDCPPDFVGKLRSDLLLAQAERDEAQRAADYWEGRYLSDESHYKASLDKAVEGLRAFAIDKWGTSNPVLVPDEDEELQKVYLAILSDLEAKGEDMVWCSQHACFNCEHLEGKGE